MIFEKQINNSRGQSLVEAALICPIIVFFLFALVWFARVSLTWQQLIGGARYGTDMIAYTDMNKTDIENAIVDYLCNNKTGRILDSSKLNVNINIADANKIDYELTLENVIDTAFFTRILNNLENMFPFTT
ncbi:MAG: pilus assembly protein, partial [Elusimicrobiota bacterium]|nr:pilus assembly protein [Elusimicrobiota bacterium]